MIDLGDVIKCKRSCDFVYQDDGRKEIEFQELDPPYARVIGVKKKATGKHMGGDTRYTIYDYEYEPPYLKVDKYHWVYECKTSLKGKPFYVLLEDAECT